MHHIIRFVVEAKDAKEARAKAEAELDSIAGEDKSYGIDYGTFFDESSAVSGSARFGELPVAMPVLSKRGLRLLLDGFAADYASFKDGLERARVALKKMTPSEIFSDRMVKYAFKKVDTQEFVYREGWGFIGPHEFDAGEVDLSKFWIVPCDVHT